MTSRLLSDAVEAPALHPDASALSAFRVLPNGEGRSYSIVEGPIEHLFRMARACGFVVPSGQDGYAVLDVLDDDDNIVQDFTIPTSRAFRWWYRKLHLRVTP